MVHVHASRLQEVRPARIIFEAVHLPPAKYLATAALLHARGYVNVPGTARSYLDTWHALDSTEEVSLADVARLPAAPASRGARGGAGRILPRSRTKESRVRRHAFPA